MISSLSLFVVLFICVPVFCQPLLKDAVNMDIELLAEESQESNVNAAAFARVSRSAEDYDYDDDFHDRHYLHHHISHEDRARPIGFFGPPGLGRPSAFSETHRFDHPHHQHSHECRHPHDFDHPHHHSSRRRGGGPPFRSFPGLRGQKGEEGDEDVDDGDQPATISRRKTHQRIPLVTETHPRSVNPTSTAMRSGVGVVGVVTSQSPNLPPPTTTTTSTSAAPPTSTSSILRVPSGAPSSSPSSFSRSADPLQSTTPSTVIASPTAATDEPTFNIDLRFGGD